MNDTATADEIKKWTESITDEEMALFKNLKLEDVDAILKIVGEGKDGKDRQGEGLLLKLVKTADEFKEGKDTDALAYVSDISNFRKGQIESFISIFKNFVPVLVGQETSNVRVNHELQVAGGKTLIAMYSLMILLEVTPADKFITSLTNTDNNAFDTFLHIVNLYGGVNGSKKIKDKFNPKREKGDITKFNDELKSDELKPEEYLVETDIGKVLFLSAGLYEKLRGDKTELRRMISEARVVVEHFIFSIVCVDCYFWL